MRIPIYLLLIGFGVAGMSIRTAACSYAHYPNPPLEYVVDRTETIYLGTLIQNKARIEKDKGTRYRVHTRIFRVEEPIKGSLRKTHTLTHVEKVTNRTSCDDDPPEMKVGEQWIVFDGYDENKGRDPDANYSLYVRDPDFLSRSFVRSEKRSQELLGRIKKSVSQPCSCFLGEIEHYSFDSPPDSGRIPVVELRTANGGAVLRSTAPDERGTFRFERLASGAYTIRIYSTKQDWFDHPVKKRLEPTSDRSSYFTDFTITIDGSRPEFEIFVLLDQR